jgi:hypothetical protein
MTEFMLVLVVLAQLLTPGAHPLDGNPMDPPSPVSQSPN